MEAYKGAIKDYRKLASAKKFNSRSAHGSVEASEAKKQLVKVYKALDKAAKTNVISRNKASRLKSRLARLIKG